jgi:quercetin dioxygenase-like cupin family protein
MYTQEQAMKSDNQARTGGFVRAADDGPAFWFLNTLTINKVSSNHTQGQLSIVDHRVPPGFAPPPHIHQASDETFLVLDGQFEGFCGDQTWQAGPGSLVFLPRAIPHGFTVSPAGPGRIIVVVSPGGFDQFVAAAGEPAQALRLPEPVPPDPARLTQLAAAHGIQILPPPQP